MRAAAGRSRMKFRYLRILLLVLVITAAGAGLALTALLKSPVNANRVDLAAVARMYPNFTLEQHMAIVSAVRSQLHPAWREMTMMQKLRELRAFVASPQNGAPPAANFVGNLTSIFLADTHLLALSQQSDCSLTPRRHLLAQLLRARPQLLAVELHSALRAGPSRFRRPHHDRRNLPGRMRQYANRRHLA